MLKLQSRCAMKRKYFILTNGIEGLERLGLVSSESKRKRRTVDHINCSLQVLFSGPKVPIPIPNPSCSCYKYVLMLDSFCFLVIQIDSQTTQYFTKIFSFIQLTLLVRHSYNFAESHMSRWSQFQ